MSNSLISMTENSSNLRTETCVYITLQSALLQSHRNLRFSHTWSTCDDICEHQQSLRMSSYDRVGEISAILGYYAAYSGNFLPTFRNNLSGPFLKVRNYHDILRNVPEERKSLLHTFK
jgi:hypothetical protein